MARQHRDAGAQEQIVEAARRCIAASGLRGATVRAIARDARVTTGSVMHYFDSKQALAMAALDRNNTLAGTRALRHSRAARGMAAVEAMLEALLPLDEQRRLEWAVWIGFWTASGSDAEAARGLQTAREALATMLARPFAEAVEDGELAPGLDFAYEAERLLVVASGLGLLVNGRNRAETRRLARRMLADHLSQLRRGASVAKTQ